MKDLFNDPSSLERIKGEILIEKTSEEKPIEFEDKAYLKLLEKIDKNKIIEVLEEYTKWLSEPKHQEPDKADTDCEKAADIRFLL